MDEKRTMPNWAARLSMQDELLTLAEAQTFASILMADRLQFLLASSEDIQMRLTRLEMFMASAVPGYDKATTNYKKLSSGGGV